MTTSERTATSAPSSTAPAGPWRYADIRTVPDIVRFWAARTPDRVAVVDGDRSWTYRELDDRSNRLANALVAHGVTPGTHVAFVGKNCAEFFALWFAATKAGAALAPFNWRCAVGELVELVDDCRPAVVVCGAEFAATIEQVRSAAAAPFVTVSFTADDQPDPMSADMAQQPDQDPAVPLIGTETALLGYTSGTTGMPKGVQLSHNAINYSFLCSALEPSLGLGRDDVLLVTMPCFHLTGSWVSLPALYHGARIVVLPAFDPTATIRAVREHAATAVCLVPAAIQAILAQPDAHPEDFASLRRIIYAGSPISADVLTRAIDRFGCDFVQFYGATEMWIITLLRPEQHDAGRPTSLTSCGTPVQFVETRIVDIELNDVQDGAIGEILARSPVMFSGYLNQPEATAAAVVDGWYRTGDLGRRDENGYHHIIDRLKDMIITGGENVYSVEVERALYRHPDVALAAVVSAPDPRWGERVTAYVVPRPGAELTSVVLEAHCRSLIAGYKVPKTIHLVDTLPMTASGKIQKGVLREALGAGGA